MRIPPALRSPKLALALCLIVALHAALGTPAPAERAAQFVRERLGEGALPAARFLGVVDTYASPLFIGLLLALVVNVAACTLYRAGVARRSSTAGRARPALDLLVHLSIVLVLAGGALKGALGSAATQYLFVGQVVTTAREGGVGPELPVGFGLLLKEVAREHFPLALEVGVSDARSGEKLAKLMIREGRGAAVPGRGLRLELGPYNVDERWVTLWASGSGFGVEELRLDIAPEGRTSGRFGDCEVQLLAWRRDLRRVRGRIAVVEGGREVKEEWLGTNERIAYRGSSVFLSSWGEDEFQNPYLGVQVMREPGAPLFWTGAVLFALATPLFLMVRHRRREETPAAREDQGDSGSRAGVGGQHAE